MKLRALWVMGLACLVLAAPAQVRKTKSAPAKEVKAKQKLKGKKEASKKAEEPKVDTVSVAVFSYAIGASQINGLKNYLAQRMQVDTVNHMDDFVRGLKEVFETPEDPKRTAYSAGLQIGSQVLTQFLSQLNQQITGEQGAEFIDKGEYMKGFLAALSGEELPFSVDSATVISTKQMEYYTAQLMEKKYADNRRAGEEFLAQNAGKDSVKVLPSGVQYKVLKEGDGPKPFATSTVSVNYEGRLIDGTVFDSSYKRGKPASFKCNQVIKGWTDAITEMPVGSTWEIYIPQELGYGGREAGQIKPFSCLIFKVELLGIESDNAAPAPSAK